MRLIEVLTLSTSVVIETSVGSAVKVTLTVAFDEEVVRRYRVEAGYKYQSLTRHPSGQLPLKVRNICGITLPACGIGPSV